MSTSESTFYFTGGTLRPDAASYVERKADKELLDRLLKGELCYVLTSRQMGKSSLMVRTAMKLREQGVRVIALDLTAIGQNLEPEQWYHGLLDSIGAQLDLEDELEQFWRANGNLGPFQRLTKALRMVVLPKLSVDKAGVSVKEQPAGDRLRTADRLVIFVDEIDIVRSLP